MLFIRFKTVNLTSCLSLAPCLSELFETCYWKHFIRRCKIQPLRCAAAVSEDFLSGFIASVIVQEWYGMSAVRLPKCTGLSPELKRILETYFEMAPDCFLYLARVIEI